MSSEKKDKLLNVVPATIFSITECPCPFVFMLCEVSLRRAYRRAMFITASLKFRPWTMVFLRNSRKFRLKWV